MLYDSFDNFPDEARLWVYGADRSLSDEEQTALLDTVETFLSGWTSHGRSVDGAPAVVDDRFLLVAGHVPGADISGCGIDSSVNIIEDLGGQLDIEWLPSLTIFYRDREGRVRALPRPDFRQKVKDGMISRETPVFDLSLETVGELRADGFERRAGESWHALVFHIPDKKIES